MREFLRSGTFPIRISRRTLLKIKNDRGEIAAKGKNRVAFQAIPLISIILRRSDPRSTPFHASGSVSGSGSPGRIFRPHPASPPVIDPLSHRIQ